MKPLEALENIRKQSETFRKFGIRKEWCYFEEIDIIEKSLKALEIIKEKGLNFNEFFNSNSVYEYNNWIAHSPYYEKLLPKEYLIFKCLLKHEWGYAKLL